jgi:hypothetical protein
VPVPKPGGVRWLAQLDVERANAYAASVVPIVPAIEGALSPSAVANRVVEVIRRPPAIRLEAWRKARRRFLGMTAELGADARAMLRADVRDCYATITSTMVEETLEGLGCPPSVRERVAATIRSFGEDGVRGLPVGPAPSAVLANAVLGRVDDRLRAAGYRHVRWVDDLLVFTAGAPSAAAALEEIEDILGMLGLELASEKTRVVAGHERLRAAAAARPSGP